MLLSASLPSYSPKKEGASKEKEQAINGDDPEMQREIDRLFDEENRV